MRMLMLLAVAVLSLLPIAASEPGEPLDCEDWVFVAPGFSCTNFARPCTASSACGTGVSSAVDNQGQILRLGVSETPLPGCPGCSQVPRRHELKRFDGQTDELIGYIDDRCTENGIELFQGNNFNFDEENGRLIIPVHSGCHVCDFGTPSGCDGYDEGGLNWMMSVNGFATTFEILHSYDPPVAALSFHVPYMPEGFERADWFDTYYGPLATVGDWSQAQPLQCGYPAASPSVGDYLTVADTLPDPAPGTGRYYVTAVNFQGQRRYGRKASGGELSGRDPAVLPVCSE